MFGRSGQMFPRRAYHDAIYEEEYGSESEEECCRGRGLSAILCWFLSVIILVGLAASVVLTVFFILRSRSFLTKNNAEDVNVVFDHGNGFKIVPTLPDNNFDFTVSSKNPFGQNGHGGQDEGGTSSMEATAARTTSTHFTSSATTMTTRLPTTSRMTTRKYYSDTTGGQSNEILDKERTTPLPPVTSSESVFKFLFDTIKTFQKDDSSRSNESIEKTPIKDDIVSNESTDHRQNVASPTTSTRRSSVQTTLRTTITPILFTLPPSTSTSQNNNKRNMGSTKFPERTSFASSEEVTVPPYQQYDHGKHYIPPSRSHSSSEEVGRVTSTSFDMDNVPTTTTERTPTTIDEPTNDDVKYQVEESSKKLTKMLIDQIPPHGQQSENGKDIFGKLTTTTLPPPTTIITEDLLAKIIKNLQPKWKSSKVVETTTTNTNKGDHIATSTRIRNRYVEKDRRGDGIKEDMPNVKIVKRIKYRGPTTLAPPQPSTIIFITPDNAGTTELPSTPIRSSSFFNKNQQPIGTASSSVFTNSKPPSRKINNFNSGQPIEIVKGPDFSAGGSSKSNNKKTNQQQLKEHSEYFDVLVGSDDHKTLVTKETEAGIITSAILPPWFDTSGNSTDTMELSNHTLKFTQNQHATSLDDDSKNNHSKPKSDIDILLNLFSNSPLPKKTNRSKSESQSQQLPQQKHINRHHEMTVEESRKSLHLKNLEEQLKPFFSSPSESSDPPPLRIPEQQQHVQPANNAFHFGSSDGTTNIYGYYPEDDLDEGESVDQVDIDVIGHGRYPPTPLQKKGRNGKEKSQQKEQRKENNSEDPLSTAPSHVIDIAYDPKARPEIVIEPDVTGSEDDGEEEEDDEYLEHDNNHDHNNIRLNRRRHHNNDDPEETMAAAGSDTKNHQVFVPPPENMISSSSSDVGSANPSQSSISRRVSVNSGGSGIRRPMTSSEEKEKDQSLVGSEAQSQHVDWSLKSTTDDNVKSDRLVESDQPQKFPSGPLVSEEEEEEQVSEKLIEPNVDNQIVERKPIMDIDESLYPSKEDQDVNDNSKEEVVVTTTTTTKPRVNVYEVYSQPYHPPQSMDSSTEIDTKSTVKPLTAEAAVESEIESEEDQRENNNGTSGGGFTPPEPMNFHDNTYTFNSQSSEYISKDGWRPVIHNDHASTEIHHHGPRKGSHSKNSPHSVNVHGQRQQAGINDNRPKNHNNGNNYYLSSSVQPPFSSSGINPHGTTLVVSSTSSTPLNLHNHSEHPSMDYDEEEEDEYENGHDDHGSLSNNNDWHSSAQHGNNHLENKGKLKIKPSMPLPASLTLGQNANIAPPSRVKFPDNSEGQRQHQQQQQQNQMNQFHHQQLQQSMHNKIIDRTKYMHRPAPPRIVMRRTPQFNFPFNRKRNTKTNGPPPLAPHRNFPRIGTQQQAPSYPPPLSSSPSGPFSSPQPPPEAHSSNSLQNSNLLRQRHEIFKNQKQSHSQQTAVSAPGAVHWPDDNFGRRNNINNNNIIHQANRRPPTAIG